MRHALSNQALDQLKRIRQYIEADATYIDMELALKNLYNIGYVDGLEHAKQTWERSLVHGD